MSDHAPVEIAVSSINDRLYADRNDLLGAVRVIAQRGGNINHVETLLLGLNFEGITQPIINVEDDRG